MYRVLKQVDLLDLISLKRWKSEMNKICPRLVLLYEINTHLGYLSHFIYRMFLNFVDRQVWAKCSPDQTALE